MNIKALLNLRKIGRGLLLVVLPALLFYVCAILILNESGYKVLQLLRDPATQLKYSSFLGFISNIGIWLWVSSAAICWFSLLSGIGRISRGHTELLILLGLLSTLLAVDDFFLLHERYVHQRGIFLFYAICAITLLVRHYRRILDIDGFAFVFSGFLLALSIHIDMNQRRFPYDYTQVQFVEEACKFVGAALWLYFCGQTAAGKGKSDV